MEVQRSEDDMELTAHYFQGRSEKVLVLARGPSLTNAIERIAVSGKREARAIAAARGARPWNF